jgi:hypothetical protein
VDAEPEPEPATSAWRGLVRRERLLVAELTALTGFVVVRPVLNIFGASPEAFLSRATGGWDVVAFALVVAVVPLLALSVLGAATGLLGDQVRQAVHLLTVAVLAALGGMQLVPMDDSWALVAVASAIGLAVAALRWRFEAARTFLRYASVGMLVFLAQFLVMSPTSSLVGGRSGGADPQVVDTVSAAVGDEAPPVVFVVMDALPTVSLLDGDGRIDADLYPNFARLAGDGTWYRNHTTVAPVTLQALPALLTGTIPDDDTRSSVLSHYPRNLFTLLGGTYDLHVHEQVTGLCPDQLCPESGAGSLGPVLDDAADLWSRTIWDPGWNQLLPGSFTDRFDRTADWIDAQDFAAGGSDSEGSDSEGGEGGDGKPGLWFQHMMLPHAEWEHLPDGSRYFRNRSATDSLLGTWGQFGWEVGIQRDVLQTQAVDTLLGRLFDRLEDAGVYDDALIVVTADHGAAFGPGRPMRALSEDNFEQIMWSPLIVKAPGQRGGDGSGDGGEIDDRNVENIDVLPMIADELGIDLADVESEDGTPWDVDGRVPGRTPDRDPADKRIIENRDSELRPNADHHMVRMDGVAGFEKVLATDLVPGEGPKAVWQRTDYGGLVGADVDDLDTGDPSDVEMQVDDIDDWQDVDIDRPRIETRALGWVPKDSAVAVVMNGQVAAMAPARPTPYGLSVVHALLDPEALVDGDNDYALYLVDGPPDDPVLHALPLTDRL